MHWRAVYAIATLEFRCDLHILNTAMGGGGNHVKIPLKFSLVRTLCPPIIS